jgi:hypothetical protein
MGQPKDLAMHRLGITDFGGDRFIGFESRERKERIDNGRVSKAINIFELGENC